MQLYHLSHIDLDGYGCQMVSKEIYTNAFSVDSLAMYFYNANYGKEVGAGTCGISAYWLNRTASLCQGWRYLVYYETNIWISSGFSFRCFCYVLS